MLFDRQSPPRLHSQTTQLALHDGDGVADAWVTILSEASSISPGQEAQHLAGEGSIDGLLRGAEELGSARPATAAGQHRDCSARLELSCAAGYFDEPEIQTIFEGTLP